jgi:hypothetical protein
LTYVLPPESFCSNITSILNPSCLCLISGIKTLLGLNDTCAFPNKINLRLNQSSIQPKANCQLCSQKKVVGVGLVFRLRPNFLLSMVLIFPKHSFSF